MDEHGAGIDELFHLGALQRQKQAAGALDIDFLVERIGLAGEIVVAGQMDDRSDAPAITLSHLVHGLLDRAVGGQIAGHAVRMLRALGISVKTDDRVILGQRLAQGEAQEAADAGNQNDVPRGAASWVFRGLRLPLPQNATVFVGHGLFLLKPNFAP